MTQRKSDKERERDREKLMTLREEKRERERERENGGRIQNEFQHRTNGDRRNRKSYGLNLIKSLSVSRLRA